MHDILAYVCRAEASTAPAKVALAIVALNIYGPGCAGLVPGVRQGGRQRVSTAVDAASITALDVRCAALARTLWARGVTLDGARACYEPAVQDRLVQARFPGYRLNSAQLHAKWLATGEVLVLERWGWRFYSHRPRSRAHQTGGSQWQTHQHFFDFGSLGVKLYV